jgi:hypothetical protein
MLVREGAGESARHIADEIVQDRRVVVKVLVSRRVVVSRSRAYRGFSESVLMICPDTSSTQNSMAAVSADGSTVCF